MNARIAATTRIAATDAAASRTRSGRRRLAMALLAVSVFPLSAVAAGAAQDAGPMIVAPEWSTNCLLTRVGTEHVRCDDLTGNGVAAPAWISTGSARATSLGAVELASDATLAVSAAPPEAGTLEWRRHGL